VKKLILFIFISILSLNAQSLQEVLNSAPIGATLKLPNGIYKGKIIINKPVTIIGMGNNVIIKGDDIGRVITINSSNVILKNLTITNSGNRIENLDSAVFMDRVENCTITKCKILNSLYGIDMFMVSNSIFSNNNISSKKTQITFRGDALKLYYSNNNLIENNTVQNSKDITLNYSNNNKFKNNTFLYNRFSTHISRSHNNIFNNNIYKYNAVSIMIMGAKDTTITNNIIKSSKGAAGIGVMIKGVSNLRFEKNTLSYNAKGLYIDGQEKAKGMKRFINYNEISYNGEALHFHANIKDNTITHNKFFGNIDDVVKDMDGYFSNTNIVEYNYWDRYTGFDRNNDNIGDTTHKIYQYADQLWHYNNKVKFFYASPIMTLMNFLANLAPFIEPNLLLEDSKPIFKD